MINICAPWTTLRGRRSWCLDLHLSWLCHCAPPSTNTYPEAFILATLTCCFVMLSHMYIPATLPSWTSNTLRGGAADLKDFGKIWLTNVTVIQYTVFVNSNMFILFLRIDNEVILKTLKLFICLISIKPENCLIIST